MMRPAARTAHRDAGEHGGEDEHPELVGLDAVAEKARAALRVAESRGSRPARDPTMKRQAGSWLQGQRRHDKQHDARAVLVQSKPRRSLKSVEALLPPKPMSLRKKASISA